MPIPPRPIPTPAPRRAPTKSTTTSSSSGQTANRPGSSLPRRGLHFMDHADIFDLPLPSSAPVKGLSGVTLVKHKPAKPVDDQGRGRRVEVGVSELLLEGAGKREKRATTATSLGFDFIPNPSVLALPDTAPSSSSPLAHTPRTPALIPTSTTEHEDDDDDDWEHIAVPGGQQQQRGGEMDDGDIILLGEMELEDDAQGGKAMTGSKVKPVPGLRSGDKSYAAVVGAAALSA